MTRTTLLLDRIATLVLAVLLIVAGLLGLAWWDGRLSGLPQRISTAPAQDLTTTPWWPWASAAVGLVVIVLALRWIWAHLVSGRVHRLRLTGSGPQGSLEADAGKVAGAAAEAFGDTAGVRSTGGVFERDRGQLVVHLTATVEPEADLGLIAAQADIISAQLAQVLQRPDVACRVELKVAARGRSLPRVT